MQARGTHDEEARSVNSLLRSLLFVPGDSERKQAKALTSAADAVILDLEDSVTAAQRPAARARIRMLLQSQMDTGAGSRRARAARRSMGTTS